MSKLLFIAQLDTKTQKGIIAATEKYLMDIYPDYTPEQLQADIDNLLCEKISTLFDWDFMRYLDSETHYTLVNL